MKETEVVAIATIFNKAKYYYRGRTENEGVNLIDGLLKFVKDLNRYLLASAPRYESDLNEQDRRLFHKLRKLQKLVASISGFPASKILSNAVLVRIAYEKPDSLEALSSIHGCDSSVISLFSNQIIEIVKSHCEQPEKKLRWYERVDMAS